MELAHPPGLVLLTGLIGVWAFPLRVVLPTAGRLLLFARVCPVACRFLDDDDVRTPGLVDPSDDRPRFCGVVLSRSLCDVPSFSLVRLEGRRFSLAP